MRDFGKIYCSLWDSERFRALPNSEAQLFYLYVQTSDSSNNIGCYKLKTGYAMDDLGWRIEDVFKALEACAGMTKSHADSPPDSPPDSPMNRAIDAAIPDAIASDTIGAYPTLPEPYKPPLLLYDQATKLVLVSDFLEYTPVTNPKHMAGALKDALNLPDSPLKALVLHRLLAFPFADHPDLVEKKQNAVFSIERCRRMVFLKAYDRSIQRAIDRAFPRESETENGEREGEMPARKLAGSEPDQMAPPGQAQPADGVPDCGPAKPGTTANISLKQGNSGTVAMGGADVCRTQTEILAGDVSCSDGFERFYQLFDLRRNKAKAKAEWEALWQEMCDNLRLYDRILIAAEREAEGRPKGPKENPRHAATFLIARGWEDYDPPAAPSAVDKNRTAWLQRLDYVRTHGALPDPDMNMETCPSDILKDIERQLEANR